MLLGAAASSTRWIESLGGDVPRIYGYRGILLAFVVQYFPLVFLLVSGALAAVDQSHGGRGAEPRVPSRRQAFFRVILPVILPSLTAGALLVFMATMADFGTPMVLGEGLRTLPTLMYGEFINELGGNPDDGQHAREPAHPDQHRRADGPALLRVPEGVPHGVPPAAPAPRRPPRGRLPLATAAVYGIVALALVPAATILVSSFMPTRGPVMYAGLTLQSYAAVLHLVPRAIANTFMLTGLAVPWTSPSASCSPTAWPAGRRGPTRCWTRSSCWRTRSRGRSSAWA